MITLAVQALGVKFKDLFGAGIDTKAAALAEVVTKSNFCHKRFPF